MSNHATPAPDAEPPTPCYSEGAEAFGERTILERILALHHADAYGTCPDCGQESPCETRRIVEGEG